MNDAVTVALIAAVPVTISALNQWRNTKSVKRQVTPSNGRTMAQLLELQGDLLSAHAMLDESRFQLIDQKLDRVLVAGTDAADLAAVVAAELVTSQATQASDPSPV